LASGAGLALSAAAARFDVDCAGKRQHAVRKTAMPAETRITSEFTVFQPHA
jgi:hypothetical protein